MTRITYGKSLYSSSIKLHAQEYLNKLPEDVDLLVSIGSSGCAIASAMLALSNRELEHTQYRKEHEDAHLPVAGSGMYRGGRRVAIVDDFIGTGLTLSGIIDRAEADKLCIKCILVAHVTECWKEDYKSKIESYNLIIV